MDVVCVVVVPVPEGVGDGVFEVVVLPEGDGVCLVFVISGFLFFNDDGGDYVLDFPDELGVGGAAGGEPVGEGEQALPVGLDPVGGGEVGLVVALFVCGGGFGLGNVGVGGMPFDLGDGR